MMDNNENKYNELVLSGTSFENSEELLKAVGEAINLLTKAGYECLIRLEETDIYVIHYNYDRSLNMGTPIACWLSEEEEMVLCQEESTDTDIEY